MKPQVSENSCSGGDSNLPGDAKMTKSVCSLSHKASKSSGGTRDENRDEWENESRKDAGDNRENTTSTDQAEQTVKRSQIKPSPSRKSKSSSTSNPSPHPSPQRHYMHEGYPSYHQPPPGRGPYPPLHGMHGGPRGPPQSSAPFPPPPPHYYGAGPHDHYRGPPPPPHYHQMPPLPHPGQAGHYGGPSGHYCPPPNMSGRPGPPPGYHPAYGAPYPPGPPPMGYHGAPPPSFPPQSNPLHAMPSVASDSNSISSSKSKGSSDRRSTKSHSSSHGTRKKRTIDGVHENTSKDKSLPVAYTFRRSNSNASTSSTVTASNNTSTETNPMADESPHKRERTTSRSSNPLPPLSHPSSNIFDEERFHRRNYSGTSTASSLSVGGFSLSSYDGPRSDSVVNDLPMLKSSPKRRKGGDSEPVNVDGGSDSKSIFKRKVHRRMASPSDSSIDGPESSRFEQLTMNDSHPTREEKANGSLFLSLSTSPINHPEVDATPISKNTKKASTKITIKTDLMDEETSLSGKSSPMRNPILDRPADTPTPPIPGGMAESEMMTDEHMLNRHLRGQSFTPLPHLSESSGASPTNTGFSAIAPQLSWSIAGDTPSLEDLAACSWEETDKDDKKRPSSTTSQHSNSTRGMVISPHSFSLWKDEHESNNQKKGEDGKDAESIRFSMLSPNSEIAMAVDGSSGTTTPLPLFFDQPGSEERENVNQTDKNSGEKKSNHSKQHTKEGDPDHIHHMFVTNGGRGHSIKHHHASPPFLWPKHDGHSVGGPPTPVYAGSKPPTPLYAGSHVGFARSPLHGDRRDHHPDFFKPGGMFGHPPPGSHNDRVRNLRGRVPHGAHLAPMPIHIPPPMSSHHPLTSPMGIGHSGKAPLWSPHHHGNMPPPLASPHHMSPMDMSQSKRKCVPLKPPIPSKFQGDMEKLKTASVPEFTSLVNFPAHMSQKQSVNLPEGMRCCVMCGQACPCSTGTKKKINCTLSSTNAKSNKSDGSLAPRSSNGQDHSMLGDKSGYAIIPTQNKGLCTLCDVNVWVVVTTGLEIKWCKGCKNFRPWAAFGDKGLATKCLRCRERQREKYALQKEEKEKSRLLKGAKTKG